MNWGVLQAGDCLCERRTGEVCQAVAGAGGGVAGGCSSVRQQVWRCGCARRGWHTLVACQLTTMVEAAARGLEAAKAASGPTHPNPVTPSCQRYNWQQSEIIYVPCPAMPAGHASWEGRNCDPLSR